MALRYGILYIEVHLLPENINAVFHHFAPLRAFAAVTRGSYFTSAFKKCAICVLSPYIPNTLLAEKIELDLENNWAVVAEAIQTILRREGYPNPYEALKGLTRTNAKINQATIADFIDTLEVSDSIKAELKVITPANYTGI